MLIILRKTQDKLKIFFVHSIMNPMNERNPRNIFYANVVAGTVPCSLICSFISRVSGNPEEGHLKQIGWPLTKGLVVTGLFLYFIWQSNTQAESLLYKRKAVDRKFILIIAR